MISLVFLLHCHQLIKDKTEMKEFGGAIFIFQIYCSFKWGLGKARFRKEKEVKCIINLFSGSNIFKHSGASPEPNVICSYP
jgi:hypothetical protein